MIFNGNNYVFYFVFRYKYSIIFFIKWIQKRYVTHFNLFLGQFFLMAKKLLFHLNLFEFLIQKFHKIYKWDNGKYVKSRVKIIEFLQRAANTSTISWEFVMISIYFVQFANILNQMETFSGWATWLTNKSK